MKTIASATDSNNRPMGEVVLDVDFIKGRPVSIVHKGLTFVAIGKIGTSFRTGETMHQLATDRDERIWSNDAATRIEED